MTVAKTAYTRDYLALSSRLNVGIYQRPWNTEYPIQTLNIYERKRFQYNKKIYKQYETDGIYLSLYNWTFFNTELY